ncbi:MAG: response regulator transcription factor [Romboutsia sp.]
MNILIVEDDSYINKLLTEILNINGYKTKSAYSGTEGLLYLSLEKFDIILLDLMLPGINGEKILHKIRQNNDIPIIIISAKDGKTTKINTLKGGADDFISKPFDIDEVLARIETNLRKSNNKNFNIENEILEYREIKINTETREVTVDNNIVNLTTREFEILKLMIQYPKKVFTKSNIFESVWSGNYLGDDNTINVHISNLRNKIANHTKNDYIQTVWGIGYKLET